MGTVRLTPQQLEAAIAELAARPEGVQEELYADREAATLASYERDRGDPIDELIAVRTFSMTTPHWRGFDRVLTGDVGGWSDIERSWLLETLSSHLIGPSLATNAHILLGHALVLGEELAARWMADVLAERIKQHPRGYADQFFAHFLLALHQRQVGDAPPPSDESLGPYAAVFEHWSAVDRLSSVLADLCTYRIEVIAAAGDDVTQFRFTPLLPLEVAAVLRLREARGEPPPRVDHPLMACPTAAVPTRRTYDPGDDPWFQRAVAAGAALQRLDAAFTWP